MILSLFPGLDLLAIPFEELGFCIVRGPDPIFGGDIRKFHPPAGKFDGIIGGPPCQSFSIVSNLTRARGREPRFGNLIPEFERCVFEAQPDWFLMENVTRAPTPEVEGYTTMTFDFDNAWLGEQQERMRRFTFGMQGPICKDLRIWIERKQMLPRVKSFTWDHLRSRKWVDPPERVPAVTGAHSGQYRPKSSNLIVYSLKDSLFLQGLPQNFLEHSPFKTRGARRAVANGVPLPLGRAIARAICMAIGEDVEVAQ